MFENESGFFLTKQNKTLPSDIIEVDISAPLSSQKTFQITSQTSQNQGVELSSWPVRADFLISHYMSLQAAA